MTTYNFSSGPAVIAPSVIAAATKAIVDLDGSGIGLLEHSHRSKEFGAVLARTEARIRELANISDEYAVLFVTAGATTHFTWIARHFLGPNKLGSYCNTGVWSQKAIEAAKAMGEVEIACSGEATKFTEIPASLSLSNRASYLHYTSNNTIFGTQWREPPNHGDISLICDASSDIFSRPIDVSRYSIIYAGAQKNLGPAGVSLVIAKRSFIATANAGLAAIEDYRVYDREKSMLNTPNTFGIFMIGESVKWIAEQGGLVAMAEKNERKAAKLYAFLDNSRVWRAVAKRGSRSTMNVTFRANDAELERQYLAEAEAQRLSGLAGHRLVGGLRASIYNAFPSAGIDALIDSLHTFEKTVAT